MMIFEAGRGCSKFCVEEEGEEEDGEGKTKGVRGLL